MPNLLSNVIIAALIICTISSCTLEEETFPVAGSQNQLNSPASQVVLLAQSGNIVLPTYNNCMDFYFDVFTAGGTSVDIPCTSSANSITINTPWQSNTALVEIEDMTYFEVTITDENDYFDQVDELQVYRDDQIISTLELISNENGKYLYRGTLLSIVVNEDNMDELITIYHNSLPVAQVSWVFEDNIIMKWIIDNHLIVNNLVFEDNIMMRTTVVDGETIEEWSIGNNTTIQKSNSHTKVIRFVEDYFLVDWVIEDDIIFSISPSGSPLVIHMTIKDDLIMGMSTSNEFVYEDNIIFRSQEDNQNETAIAESYLFSIAEGYSNVFEDHVFFREGTNAEDIKMNYIIEEHVMVMNFVTEDHVILRVSLTDTINTGITIVQPANTYELFISVGSEGENVVVTATLSLQDEQESVFPSFLTFNNSYTDGLPELTVAQKSFSAVTYTGLISQAVLNELGAIQVIITPDADKQLTIKDDIL